MSVGKISIRQNVFQRSVFRQSVFRQNVRVHTCNGIYCAAILIRLVLALLRAVVVSHRLTYETLSFCWKSKRRGESKQKKRNKTMLGTIVDVRKKNQGQFSSASSAAGCALIVDCLSERLHKRDTVMRECVKPAEMCCLSLFFQSACPTALTSNTSCDASMF